MRRPLVYLLITAILILGVTARRASATDEEDQRLVAEKFLQAYVANDTVEIRRYVATRPENLFSPYPFTSAVTLSAPKVDENQALVDFTARVADRNFPPRGGILCKKRKDGWFVRQVLYYDQVPGALGLPSRSITSADKRQEPRVKAVASAFLDAWKRDDRSEMVTLWHNWTLRDGKPNEGLSISNVKMTTHTTVWKDAFIRYSARLTYKWGPFSYSIAFKGGLVLVKEGEEWRVRPTELIFDL